MRILGIFALTAVGLMGIWTAGYGQPYEPELLWDRSGEEPDDRFGSYVAGIGDVDGDGCEDFLARAKIEGEGVIDLFYGGDPPDTIPDIIFRKPDPNCTYFGPNFDNIGDVNGDQQGDFAVSARYIADDSSIVYVYFGGSLLDTLPDVAMVWSPFTDGFGSNIRGIGDVNGDGYDDLAVFAANYDHGRGKVWVYYGGNPMDSIADWEREGSNQHVGFGQSIAGKGDLNGDGYDDFVIWEWTGYPDRYNSTHLIFFGGSELDTIPDLAIPSEDYYPPYGVSRGSAIVSNLNGDRFADLIVCAGLTDDALVFFGGDPMDIEVDLALEGFATPIPDDLYAMAISCAGDVNRDNYDDLLISQTSYNSGYHVYVFFGGSWIYSQPYIQWDEGSIFCSGIGVSIADCGDINGDGVDDIIFGSYHMDFNSEGRLDIWKGDTAFVVSVPEESSYPVPKNFRLLPPYPNPFNSTVSIPFEIFDGVHGDISVIIYNVLGQMVVDLRSEVRDAMARGDSGPYVVTWDGRNESGVDCGSGVYIIMLQWGVHRQLRKAVLLR